MAEDKKAPGRPKKTENVEVSNEKTAQNEVEVLEKPTKKEKVIEVKTPPKPDKVIEVKTPTTRRKPSEERKITHTVNVNGRDREISRQSYEAISKDPRIKIVLPKNTRLIEPNGKPCKDC